MTEVLSTRNLNKTQKSLLEEAGIRAECYDALHISLISTHVPSGFKKFIFTSKNGVKGYLKNLNSLQPSKEITCYCVGEKTLSYLEENGLYVAKMANNAEELADFLIKNDEKEPFLIFAGNRNRPELRDGFTKNHIPFSEVQVYETDLNPRKFDKAFQYILFFSPSGVQSFLQANSPEGALALCIGETSAREARKHFSRVLTAEKPTVDAVLHRLIEINSKHSNS